MYTSFNCSVYWPAVAYFHFLNDLKIQAVNYRIEIVESLTNIEGAGKLKTVKKIH